MNNKYTMDSQIEEIVRELAKLVNVETQECKTSEEVLQKVLNSDFAKEEVKTVEEALSKAQELSKTLEKSLKESYKEKMNSIPDELVNEAAKGLNIFGSTTDEKQKEDVPSNPSKSEVETSSNDADNEKESEGESEGQSEEESDEEENEQTIPQKTVLFTSEDNKLSMTMYEYKNEKRIQINSFDFKYSDFVNILKELDYQEKQNNEVPLEYYLVAFVVGLTLVMFSLWASLYEKNLRGL